MQTVKPDLLILPLLTNLMPPQQSVALAGGKGSNLIRLANAGFHVPPGFILTTSAYRRYLDENGLEPAIWKHLPAKETAGVDTLENASLRIRSLFTSRKLPAGLRDQILAAYREAVHGAVAVRSSATTEDLPGYSFAGQQDTFLNILDEKSLLKAIVDCWSSLWTARAIGYRARNSIPHAGISLAVVVQQMVQSEVSGVLFTANPLTGLRGEVVIDATFGLGEALVSGQVEPDHYVVDPTANRITSKTLGLKALSIRSRKEGGTIRVESKRAVDQALPDDQIIELASLGKQVESLDGVPQDIEWALAGGKIHLLQTRPVTSIFPIPRNPNPAPLDVYGSFAAIQGILDPITPMGRDAMNLIFAVMSSTILRKKITLQEQTILLSAGERLWSRVTPLLRNTIGRKITGTALRYIEPGLHQSLMSIMNDPRFLPVRKGIRPATAFTLARTFVPLAGKVLHNILSPEKRRAMIVQNGEDLLAEMQAGISALEGDRYQRLEAASGLLRDYCEEHLSDTFLLFVSGVAAGMASFNMLHKAASNIPERLGENGELSKSDLLMEVTRGMPNNPTTIMDLNLWEISRVVCKDRKTKKFFGELSAAELARKYTRGELPSETADGIHAFMEKYGQRGLGEIDLGRSRWIEDPAHVFESLKGYIQIKDPERAPDVIFAEGQERARAAIETLAREAGTAKHGWFKSRLTRFAADRTRRLMGIRENPKFFAVRLMGFFRQALLKISTEFVDSGELKRTDDVFFLTFEELGAFSRRESADWAGLIQSRRDAYGYEMNRRQIPRLILSDGRSFYEGVQSAGQSDATVAGSPVSPGTVEGCVRVVLDPRASDLQPGEIMVCPGTDPSWTPLFLTAGGLIMEVGGMMTHGAVVAREYGIPAVVGVTDATTRLVTGQRIRLDGSSGRIEILTE